MSNKKWQKKGMPKKGEFIPENKQKYIMVENDQNGGKIIYRSSWERVFMYWLDNNPSVVRWNSEGLPIPYIKPTDFKTHRYFPDFYFESIAKDGSTKRYLIEVKPKHETIPPVFPKRKTEKSLMNHQKRIVTYQVNQAKWESARAFCAQNNMEFMIITEDHLGM